MTVSHLTHSTTTLTPIMNHHGFSCSAVVEVEAHPIEEDVIEAYSPARTMGVVVIAQITIGIQGEM